MIEIEMSKDIRDFEPKLIGPFTSRQMVCIAVGVACGLPWVILPIPLMLKLVLAVVFAAPGIACGYIKVYGIYAEKFFLNVMLPIYINPQKRKYKTENTYEYLIAPSEEELQLQEKEKNKKKKVRYTKQYRPYN